MRAGSILKACVLLQIAHRSPPPSPPQLLTIQTLGLRARLRPRIGAACRGAAGRLAGHGGRKGLGTGRAAEAPAPPPDFLARRLGEGDHTIWVPPRASASPVSQRCWRLPGLGLQIPTLKASGEWSAVLSLAALDEGQATGFTLLGIVASAQLSQIVHLQGPLLRIC